MQNTSPQFSIIDLFTIGIGPSSSHTVGPMKAAAEFAESLQGLAIGSIRCGLFGSLADTGKGHGTGKAILLGLLGHDPKTIPIDEIDGMLAAIKDSRSLTLASGQVVSFVEKEHLVYHRGKTLGSHTNAMHFTALDESDEIIKDELVYSIGGGFIVKDGEKVAAESVPLEVAYPFRTGDGLLEICERENLSISEIVLANESAFRAEIETRSNLDEIWRTMEKCIERGLNSDGVLPGGLKVERRARRFHDAILKSAESPDDDTLTVMDWVDVFAIAVNEENAAGGRVVTAPTNGAAGVIPAVLKYAVQFRKSPHDDGIHRFFLTAGAIGSLYKKNASISGADVGCQGEVGVACSMAAGALTEYLGGTPKQVEFAAEIGMEHNLGLTCDPIGGLVQIPCIERNAMGAIKAINASRLAMRSEGIHHVSLDKVIRTMKATGADMLSKYKETARGGLAVNIVEC